MLACGCAGSHHVATAGAPSHSSAPEAAQTQVVATIAATRLPSPRTRAVAVAEGGRILVLGGLVGGSSAASVLAVDPGTGTVTRAGTLAVPTHDAAGAVLNGRAHVFGGGNVGSISAIQTFDASASRVTGHLPLARSDLAAGIVDDRVYVAGGFNGNRLTPYVLSSSDGDVFHIAGTLARAVRYPALTTLGHSVFLIGGSTASTESSATGQVDLIQRFDADTNSSAVVGHLPHPLAHASAFVLSGELFVAGGVVGRQAQTGIYRVDTSSGTVTVVASLPGPRSDAAAVVVGDTAWLVGGEAGGPAAPLDTIVRVQLQHP